MTTLKSEEDWIKLLRNWLRYVRVHPWSSPEEQAMNLCVGDIELERLLDIAKATKLAHSRAIPFADAIHIPISKGRYKKFLILISTRFSRSWVQHNCKKGCIDGNSYQEILKALIEEKIKCLPNVIFISRSGASTIPHTIGGRVDIIQGSVFDIAVEIDATHSEIVRDFVLSLREESCIIATETMWMTSVAYFPVGPDVISEKMKVPDLRKSWLVSYWMQKPWSTQSEITSGVGTPDTTVAGWIREFVGNCRTSSELRKKAGEEGKEKVAFETILPFTRYSDDSLSVGGLYTRYLIFVHTRVQNGSSNTIKMLYKECRKRNLEKGNNYQIALGRLLLDVVGGSGGEYGCPFKVPASLAANFRSLALPGVIPGDCYIAMGGDSDLVLEVDAKSPEAVGKVVQELRKQPCVLTAASLRIVS